MYAWIEATFLPRATWPVAGAQPDAVAFTTAVAADGHVTIGAGV